jgi:uncharacterized membrane protein YoaK (UPF0700 family)
LRPPSPLSVPQKAAVALLMTWAAGFVDLVGFLSLYRIYPAHMTGNTVAMARYVEQGNIFGILRHAWPIAMFVFGLMAGAFIFDFEKRRGVIIRLPATLLIEAVLIAAFIAGAGAPAAPGIPPEPAAKFFVMVALLCVAMGIQNASIRKIGGINVYTTFVTGSLVKFAEGFSQYLFWLRDRTSHRFRRRIGIALRLSPRQPSFQKASLTGALWMSYFIGATIGAVAYHAWAQRSLIVPLALLLLIAAFGALRPIIQSTEDWLNE